MLIEQVPLPEQTRDLPRTAFWSRAYRVELIRLSLTFS